MAESVLDRIRLNAKPVARPDSIVIVGRVRFTVLTSRLIRLEWSENGVFEDRGTFAFPNREAQTPQFKVEDKNGILKIDTGDLQLTYRQEKGPFSADNLSISLNVVDQTVTWNVGMVNFENLRGTRRTLDICPGDANLDEGLISRAGWSLFDDTSHVLWTDDKSWITPRPDHALQDWYFFGYGHDYKAALRDYTTFGGVIPLIPRFVLGAWWSRFWAYSDQDLRQLVADFKTHKLPLDVLVIDMDWHLPGWTGYTWNRDYFPDPPAFLEWVHQQGLRVTLNLHPADGVGTHEASYPQFAKAVDFNQTDHTPIPFGVTDPTFIKNYFEVLHHPLEEQGVDFWWMDWQQGETTDMPGLDPLLWLNHLHFQDSARRGTRPMLYSRWGGLGNHRYHIGFSGDSYPTWEALAFQPYFTATAANVGFGWWSHDIGGHFTATEPELFARWVQYGALSPCLRLHSTKDPLAERRPWMFPAPVFEACKTAFQLRYQLVPYLYTMAYEAAQTSISLCRPMYYEHPEAESAYLARYQYYLGDSIIAAPIVTPANPQTGLASTDVWLPDGTWIDFTTKERFTGPKWERINGDLNRVPMLVRAGAIIPQAALANTTDAIAKNNVILSIFPGADGEFRLYEDDDTTEAYTRGEFEITLIRARHDGDNTIIEIEPVEGRCSAIPEKRWYEIRLEGMQFTGKAKVNGQESFTKFAPELNATKITVQRTSKSQKLEIVATGGTDLTTVAKPAQLRPLGRVFEYSTLAETAQHLGTVLVAAPADNTPFTVAVTWALYDGDKVETQQTVVKDSQESLILHNPFTFEGGARTMRWGAEIGVHWNHETNVHEHTSKTIFPAIAHWQSFTYNRAEFEISPEHVEVWDTHDQQPDLSYSITQAYVLALTPPHHRADNLDIELAAYVRTHIESKTARRVILNLWHIGTVQVALNNELLTPIAFELAESHDPIMPPIDHPENECYELMLHEGENEVLIHTTPIKGLYWRISGFLYGEDGKILVG